MLLAVDIGNTVTMYGLFLGRKLVHHFEITTQTRQTKDEMGALLGHFFNQKGIRCSDVKSAVVSCVVPSLQPVIRGMICNQIGDEPLCVGPGIKTGLDIRFSNPHEMGADRICNSVAAYHLYGGDHPLIIIDFGTATSFCALDEKGSYRGGILAPGIAISVEALFQKAAKLPWVELGIPTSVIGSSTAKSLQSGIVFGFADMVDGLVGRIKRQGGANAKVVATGSFTALMREVCTSIDVVDPLLTLKGLAILYERNISKT